VISDEKLTYCASQARRVTLLLHKQALEVYRTDFSNDLLHATSPEERIVISVIGFSNRGIPVLVGYRLPEELLVAYRPFLERFVNSVLVLS
jgi:hypothetical protein